MKWLFLILCFGAIMIGIQGCGNRAPSYSSFSHRDAPYYAKLAEACDMLVLSTGKDPKFVRELEGDDELLPNVLHDLQPSKVQVASGMKLHGDDVSFVILRVGEGRGRYSVVWEVQTNQIKQLECELSAQEGKGKTKVLFKVNKSF